VDYKTRIQLDGRWSCGECVSGYQMIPFHRSNVVYSGNWLWPSQWFSKGKVDRHVFITSNQCILLQTNIGLKC